MRPGFLLLALGMGCDGRYRNSEVLDLDILVQPADPGDPGVRFDGTMPVLIEHYNAEWSDGRLELAPFTGSVDTDVQDVEVDCMEATLLSVYIARDQVAVVFRTHDRYEDPVSTYAVTGGILWGHGSVRGGGHDGSVSDVFDFRTACSEDPVPHQVDLAWN